MNGRHAKDMQVRDKPFGVEVRNVRCMRCGAYGHQNTDRVCPKYGLSREGDDEDAMAAAAAAASAIAGAALQVEDPAQLMQQMQTQSGLMLSQRVLGRVNDPLAANQQILLDTPEDADAAFLASLSDKERQKLFRKLDRLEAKKEHKKEKKDKKDKRKRKHGDRSDDEEYGQHQHDSPEVVVMVYLILSGSLLLYFIMCALSC